MKMMTKGRLRARIIGSALALTLALGARAEAYDPATTHAGLTQRAVLASSLHKVLTVRLARPLGLFEPVVLSLASLPDVERRSLAARLAALDPAGGYKVGDGDDGAGPALAWVVAGAVIAKTPAERGRNLFYDPSRGTGLGDVSATASFGQSLRELVDGGGFRDLATGTDFNGTGMPATAWLVSPENDVGLVAFADELEAAVASASPAARGTALARALLALGGSLAVLEDAGEPAHVRNDFAGAYLARGRGDSPFDRGSAFERYVADRYGQAGVPAPAAAVSRPTALAFITAADAQGLADRTQRRFFSAGTVPEDAIVDRDTTTAEIMRDARGSLAYGLPRLPRLELAAFGKKRYASADGLRLLAYERVPGRVRFFLDDGVYADTARALLPEIGAYATGLIEHLFRAELAVDVKPDEVSVRVSGARGAVTGRVRVFAEDARGQRTELGSATLAAGDDGVSAARVSWAAGGMPSGTRRIAAALRGQDEAGELVSVAELAPPSAP